MKFPEPLKEPPPIGQRVYFAEPLEEDFYSSCEWRDEPIFTMYLKRGFVHSSKENAIAHAKALIEFSKKKGKKS